MRSLDADFVNYLLSFACIHVSFAESWPCQLAAKTLVVQHAAVSPQANDSMPSAATLKCVNMMHMRHINKASTACNHVILSCTEFSNCGWKIEPNATYKCMTDAATCADIAAHANYVYIYRYGIYCSKRGM